MSATNKLIFSFLDSNEKIIYITISKVRDYDAELETKADDIAQTILINKACLNLDLVSLKKIEHVNTDTTDIIKDGKPTSS